MKPLRKLLVAAAALPLLVACDPAGDTYAGILGGNANNNTAAYANTAYAYVGFGSYGSWHIEAGAGSEWCSFAATSGRGGMFYTIPVRLSANTTGSARSSLFTVRDDEDGGDVYWSFRLWQHATRGDGSLGSSPLVSAITGDDGSSISLRYDTLSRPTMLLIEKAGATISRLEITYGVKDSSIAVTDGRTTLRGTCDQGYQPERIASQTDTVGYYQQLMLPGSYEAFNVERHAAGGEVMAQALLYTNGSFRTGEADGEYTADSLSWLHRRADGTQRLERLKLSYSENSNRCQTVDVNQLLLGVEECNPYQLIALFRDARGSKIISEAAATDGKYTVATTLNADKSVNTMTVTDKDGARVTYTFDYYTALP